MEMFGADGGGEERTVKEAQKPFYTRQRLIGGISFPLFITPLPFLTLSFSFAYEWQWHRLPYLYELSCHDCLNTIYMRVRIHFPAANSSPARALSMGPAIGSKAKQ